MKPALLAARAPLPCVPAGHELAVTQDTLLEDVHFFAGTPAFDVGYKSAAVNLSDLAAMGAQPAWLNVHVYGEPRQCEDASHARRWLAEFEQGFASASNGEDIGDDIHVSVHSASAKSLRVTVSAGGHLPAGQALQRRTAKVGDRLGVTGSLGDAGAALELLYAGTLDRRAGDHAHLLARLERPRARIAAGLALRGLASAAMDLSDGLAGDVSHMRPDGLGAYIKASLLPLSPELVRVMGRAHGEELALSAGDDYELLCAVNPRLSEAAEQAVRATGVALTWVGHMTGCGTLSIDGLDDARNFTRGFAHF